MNKVRYGKPHKFSTGPVGGTMIEYSVQHAIQCKSKNVLCDKQCQGVAGHNGMCWAYDESGWLLRWKQKKDIRSKFDIASERTPPGHERYIHPVDMQKQHFLSFVRRKKLRTFQDDFEPDTKLVSRLNKQVAALARDGRAG